MRSVPGDQRVPGPVSDVESPMRETCLHESGVLYLLVGIFGGFAQCFVYPKVYVAGNAATTASHPPRRHRHLSIQMGLVRRVPVPECAGMPRGPCRQRPEGRALALCGLDLGMAEAVHDGIDVSAAGEQP